MKYFYLIFFSTIILFSSCGKGGKGLFVSKKKVVKQRTDMLLDSMNVVWEDMIEADNRKLASVERLLEEVSYTENHDSKKLSKAKQLHESLKDIRYEQETMTSNQIDKYDYKTDSLLRLTFSLVEETPEMESHSITETLEKEIKHEDSQVIFYRVRYDRWAKEFNNHIKENNKKISKLGAPYVDYGSMPIFELPQ